MLKPTITRRLGPTRVGIPVVTTTPMTRNSGTVSTIGEQVMEQLREALMGKRGGTLKLNVRLLETGDIRGYELGFLPEQRTQ